MHKEGLQARAGEIRRGGAVLNTGVLSAWVGLLPSLQIAVSTSDGYLQDSVRRGGEIYRGGVQVCVRVTARLDLYRSGRNLGYLTCVLELHPRFPPEDWTGDQRTGPTPEVCVRVTARLGV